MSFLAPTDVFLVNGREGGVREGFGEGKEGEKGESKEGPQDSISRSADQVFCHLAIWR